MVHTLLLVDQRTVQNSGFGMWRLEIFTLKLLTLLKIHSPLAHGTRIARNLSQEG
jgi:hypothetical protein